MEVEGNIGADVIRLTSADLVFRALQTRQDFGKGTTGSWTPSFQRRSLPIASVIDGHPHTRSLLGSVRTVRQACLGVSEFGQSGELDTAYEHRGIDTETMIGAALDAMG